MVELERREWFNKCNFEVGLFLILPCSTEPFWTRIMSPDGRSSVDDKDSKPYLCQIGGCRKRYRNANGLKYHTRNAHSNPVCLKKDSMRCVSKQLFETQFNARYLCSNSIMTCFFHFLHDHTCICFKFAVRQKSTNVIVAKPTKRHTGWRITIIYTTPRTASASAPTAVKWQAWSPKRSPPPPLRPRKKVFWPRSWEWSRCRTRPAPLQRSILKLGFQLC